MSRVSNALAIALTTMGITQKAFAKQSGIEVSQLNRYVRGVSEIGASSLETVARNLPQDLRANVVAAWLRDHIPQSASGQIGINTAAPCENGLPAPAPFVGDLSPQLNDAVKYLADQACRHTEISDLLIDLAKALRGP